MGKCKGKVHFIILMGGCMKETSSMINQMELGHIDDITARNTSANEVKEKCMEPELTLAKEKVEADIGNMANSLKRFNSFVIF